MLVLGPPGVPLSFAVPIAAVLLTAYYFEALPAPGSMEAAGLTGLILGPGVLFLVMMRGDCGGVWDGLGGDGQHGKRRECSVVDRVFAGGEREKGPRFSAGSANPHPHRNSRFRFD